MVAYQVFLLPHKLWKTVDLPNFNAQTPGDDFTTWRFFCVAR